LSILQGNSCSIDQKSDEIWIVQTDLQQIYPKLDRLLGASGSGMIVHATLCLTLLEHFS
jgi:hypothetical protein